MVHSSRPLRVFYQFHDIISRQSRLDLMYPSIVNDPSPYASDRLVWSDYVYDPNLPFVLSQSADFGQFQGLHHNLSAVLHDMHHLTLAIESKSQQPGTKPLSYAKADLLDFDAMRKALEYRLLILKPDDTAAYMPLAGHPLEISRLAALIYLQYAVPMRAPNRQRLQNLREQLIQCLRRMEVTYAVDAENSQPGVLLWAQSVATAIPWDDEEGANELWIAQRIARVVRATGIATWAEMARRPRGVCWTEFLHKADCKRIREAVQRTNKCYWCLKYLTSKNPVHGAYRTTIMRPTGQLS